MFDVSVLGVVAGSMANEIVFYSKHNPTYKIILYTNTKLEAEGHLCFACHLLCQLWYQQHLLPFGGLLWVSAYIDRSLAGDGVCVSWTMSSG
jgi:hypothetical protein